MCLIRTCDGTLWESCSSGCAGRIRCYHGGHGNREFVSGSLALTFSPFPTEGQHRELFSRYLASDCIVSERPFGARSMHPGRSSSMSKKLYVGNLSVSTTSEQLQGLFTPFGKVDSARVVTDHQSGASRGFGFVEMPDDQEADAAVKGLSGKEQDGRALKVNEAKVRREAGAHASPDTIAPGATSSN